MSEADNIREISRYMACQYIFGNRELVSKALFSSAPRILVPLITLEMASAMSSMGREHDLQVFLMLCREKANEWDRKAYCTTAWVEIENRFADLQAEGME